VNRPDLGDDEVEAICQVLTDTGALDAVEDEIESLRSTAVEVIDHASVPPVARDALVELAGFVSARRH
jgi:hypothetical protein